VLAASSPDELIEAVHDNLRNLDVGVLDLVNLRNMFDDTDRAGASIEAGLTYSRTCSVTDSSDISD
jgi:pyridoxine 4-dehydrogenase